MGKITRDEFSIQVKAGWKITLSIQSDLYFSEKLMKVESDRRVLGTYQTQSGLVIEFEPDLNEGVPKNLLKKVKFSEGVSGKWLTASYRAGNCRSYVYLNQEHETAGHAIQHRFGGGSHVVEAANQAVSAFQAALKNTLDASEKRAIAKNAELEETPWGRVAVACGFRPLEVSHAKKLELERIASYFEQVMSAAQSKNAALLKEAENLIRKKTARISELEKAVLDQQAQITEMRRTQSRERMAPMGLENDGVDAS